MDKSPKYLTDYRKGRPDSPNIEGRIGSLLSLKAYNIALDFGVELYESDVQWIENNITKNSKNNNRDIFWQFDSYTHLKNKSPYIMDYMATFFGQFIDTHGIPNNVNRLLIYTVGSLNAWYDIKKKSTPYQHFL